jgi:ribosome-binding protein aMBF1 (putative translation factor)
MLQQLFTSVPCPACGAPAGAPCARIGTDETQAPHPSRRKSARAQRAGRPPRVPKAQRKRTRRDEQRQRLRELGHSVEGLSVRDADYVIRGLTMLELAGEPPPPGTTRRSSPVD